MNNYNQNTSGQKYTMQQPLTDSHFAKHPKAELNQRVFAGLIDLVCVGALIFLAAFPLTFLSAIFGPILGELRGVHYSDLFDYLDYTLILIYWGEVLVTFLYYFLLLLRDGQTLGAKALGIRFVTSDNNYPRPKQAFVQASLYVLGVGFVPILLAEFTHVVILACLGLLLPIWAVWDKEKQTLYDKLARLYAVQV